MIGIILVTHGALARELIAVAEHVVGKQTHVVPVCIGPEDDIDARRQEIIAAVESADRGAGVVIVTDMFGGTPSNLAISVMAPGRVEVIAGVNVPMLIKLLSIRDTVPLVAATVAAQEAGRKYINVASNLLKKQAG
ncbi:MAG: PTS fructose transporter subunit IIA [Azospirillum brasilense]|nr:MAG: PTS fructose transporter subunit IIA [Azospirillum brasilense]